MQHSCKVKRAAKSQSALRTRSFRGAEQSAPSEFVIHRYDSPLDAAFLIAGICKL